jgi:hypothetical protein
MAREQFDRVDEIVYKLVDRYGVEMLEGQHGDAIGGDAEFDGICKSHGVFTTCRPSAIISQRANTGALELQAPCLPLVRNVNIVEDVSFLIAAPLRDNEELHSGTWATVRYARLRGVPHTIVFRNGTFQATKGKRR